MWLNTEGGIWLGRMTERVRSKTIEWDNFGEAFGRKLAAK